MHPVWKWAFIDKMAAKKEEELQELNVILKSLAIRINRYRPLMKTHDFSFSPSNMLDVLFNVMSTAFETFLDLPIKIQPYGSKAEGFNYQQDFEDFGDFDFMIFPTSENIMIHNEMIEYLPENPMHVRIRGADHPVLQSCLVEGTEFVATSALKNFHPAIYGRLGDVMPCMDTWMAQDKILSLPNLPFISLHSLKNSVNSPALTFAVALSTAKASAFFDIDAKESTKSDNQFETNEDGQPVISLWNHFSNASNKEDENIPVERRNKQIFDRFAGDMKRTLKKVTAEEMVFSFDFVPALKSAEWPKVAQEWIKRKRKWPSSSMVEKVIQEGFHLVVKPPKDGGCAESDFRISFSHAEFLLSQEINYIQRECYLCLKQYHRAYLSTLSGDLTTFHLKNVYLQTIEETGAEMWREGNRAECMMKLLGKLLEALRKKDLPNFFVKSHNLFSSDYIEDPEILKTLAGAVEEIMKNLMKFSKDMLQNQESEEPCPWQVKKKESVPSRTFTPFGKLRTDGQEHVEIDGTLAIQRENEVMLSANQPEKNSLTSHSPDDLKDLFFATMKELTDLASNEDDDTHEALDPLERSLVEEFRDIGKKWSLEWFSETIYRSFGAHQLFLLMVLRPEPNLRRRVLAVMPTVVKTTKHGLQHVDSGAPDGVLGAVLGLFDPTENAIDWSQVMPPGFEHVPHSLFTFCTEFLENCLPEPAQPQEFDMDDIALD